MENERKSDEAVWLGGRRLDFFMNEVWVAQRKPATSKKNNLTAPETSTKPKVKKEKRPQALPSHKELVDFYAYGKPIRRKSRGTRGKKRR